MSLLALGLLLAAGFGNSPAAATVVTEPDCESFGFRCFVGFRDLEILGLQYDADVLLGPLGSIVETGVSSWGDPAFAAAAAAAIESAINEVADPAEALINVFIGGLPNTVGLFPPRLLLPVSIGESVALGSPGTSVFGQCVDGSNFPGDPYVFANSCELSGSDGTVTEVLFSVATFTPASAVPLPPALWLFGGALLGLIGATGRQRTRDS